MSRALALTLALLLPAACASVPDVATRESDVARAADYPTLAPLPQLLARAEAPARAAPARSELNARAEALRNRTQALRNRPVS